MYADAVLGFVREHGVRVVLPVGDANITLLAPHRERFTELGSFLAVASDASLEIANDKTRTLEVASKLDIDYPKSVQVSSGGRPEHGRGAVRLPLRAQADGLVDRRGGQPDGPRSR